MKSERGITLSSLVIYIIVTIMGVAILATVMAFFSRDVKDMSRNNIEIAELDKFYSFFLKDVKKTNSSVSEISEDNKSITFMSGNKYSFADESIYLNDKIKLAENIDNCTFEQAEENGKTTITTAITINEKTYTRQFVLGTSTTTIAQVDEKDYVHHELPPEYQKVEYLESTGTQYIDTGYKPNSNTRTIIDFAITKTVAEFRPLFGSRDATNSKAYAIWVKFDTNKVYPQYGNIAYNGNGAIDKQFVENERCIMDFDKNVLRFNNTEITCQEFTFETSYNMLLLAIQSGATVDSRKPCARLYSCKIYDDGDLVRDFVPCYRKSDGKPGLYDLAKLRFYTNAGTTDEFEVGRDNKERYQRVQYIQSNGQQHIDTGVIGKSGLETFANLEFVEAPNNAIVLGSAAGDVRFQPIQIYPSKWCIGYGNYYSSNTAIADSTKYSIYCKLYSGEQQLTVNGQSVYSNTLSDTINTGYNMFIFTRNADGSAGTKVKMKLYDLKIVENGDTIRNFIPCYRKCDNKPGLYDLVNDIFYKNAGTGDFTTGDLLTWSGVPIADYQEVEYLESKGAQWINTNYYPNQETSIELDSQILNFRFTTTFVPVLGARDSAKQKLFAIWVRNNYSSGINFGNYDSSGGGASIQDRHTIKNVSDDLYIDNSPSITGNNTIASFNSDLPMYIFDLNDNGRALTRGLQMRLYSLQILEGNTLKRNYIPCKRKTDSKPGLYDTVEGVFYTNLGVTNVDFDVGPNV